MPEMQGYPASVSVLLLNSKRQVLLVRRADTGDWCAPGGKLECGEHLYEGAARELWEETRAQVRDGFVHAFFKTGNNWNGAPLVGLYVAGWCAWKGYNEIHNAEPTKHTAVQWFDLKDVPSNTWDRQQVVGFLNTAGMVS